MKWTPGGRSDDLEDVRGQSAGGGFGFGGGRGVAVPLTGGGIVIAILYYVITSFMGGGGDVGPGAQQPAASRGPGGPTDRDIQFVSFVLDDVQKTYEGIFRDHGWQYEHAHLVVFTDAIDTGCGESSSAVGPFYCPPDRKAYIDLSFFRELTDRFGAKGEFAQAYVLAHEIGHHVQNLLGIEREHKHDRDFSIKLELQADCFAGVWGHSTDQRHLLEQGEAQEAIDAAAAIGDDRLQKMAGRRVNPETWTHGSSEERVRWFRRGFDSGRLEDCDTFSAPSL